MIFYEGIIKMVYLRLIYKMNTDSVESGRYLFKMTGFGNDQNDHLESDRYLIF